MPRVLSTKCLTESQKNLILQSGWSLVAYNAIQTKAFPNLSYLENAKFENGIVTSQTSVSILKEKQVKLKNVFCVGQKTASKLKELNFSIAEVANYGEDLAKIISTTYTGLSFSFFCGRIRNDELPSLLKKNKIDFTEHHLYETVSNPKKFTHFFDAVMFFSPSGIKSYYAHNSFKGERIICIGKTTAMAARQINNKIEIANKTSVESVIVQLVKQVF